MTSSDEISRHFPRGEKVTGTVRSRASFGYFVSISGVEVPGLIETVFLTPSEMQYLTIGAEIEAVVLQFRDRGEPWKSQIRLAIDPAALAKVQDSSGDIQPNNPLKRECIPG